MSELNDNEILQLNDLCDRLVDQTILPEEHRRLEKWLDDSEEARKHYLRRMNLSASLHDYAAEFLGEEGQGSNHLRDSRFAVISSPALLSVIGISMIAVVFAAVGFFNREQDLTNPVARLVASVEAEWESSLLRAGSDLTPDIYHLLAGAVDIEMIEGVRLSLRGPARFELVSENGVRLIEGKMVAMIPEEALGFQVTTPQSEVIDLGTEFGLEVDDSGQTDVHVLDGLVEVYRRGTSQDQVMGEAGIKITEGQARRLNTSDGFQLETIPIQQRRELLENQRFDEWGFSLLRGRIRVKDTLSRFDLKNVGSGPPQIEVIPEETGILLEKETRVTIREPGNYRYFAASDLSIPEGTPVDSYLLHFRSAEGEPVRGVIKFDQPVLGLICESSLLKATDGLGGLKGVQFPNHGGYRGLEPFTPQQMRAVSATSGGGRSADEVTLSQDLRTLGLRVNVNPNLGVDEIRVLTLSKQ